jgi:trk system potassium uptake protein TrkH
MIKLLRKLSTTQLVALAFLIVIVIGALLLLLPISTRDGTSAPLLTCFFTATSATCVTGLIVVDTYMQWSLFGQIVILLMIQIGGLGVMTIISIVTVMMRRKLGLYERTLLMQSTGFLTHDGITHLIRRILYGTMLFEGSGALLLAIRFIPKMGVPRGIWNAIFHSVSAFCNAGFDLMGKYGAFSSLTTFQSDPMVCLTIVALIFIGGIGFLVWEDLYRNGLHFKRYRLHTKIVLLSSGVLLTLGTVLFFIFERNDTMAGMNFGQRLLSSLFLSSTCRTAGFDNLGLSGLSDSSAFLAMLLMFIGGSPGSTAGGIKTTTIAVLLLDAFASSARYGHVTIFKRRVGDDIIKRAIAIASVYLFAIAVSTLLICAFEPFGLKEVLFEVTSAIGTVGLTMGITTSLKTASRLILMLLMYAGRIGGMSLVLILGQKRRSALTQRPTENILIG